MTYAFTFDASACTGCKACQIACKDKNNLPTGVLWRRVFEVSGGSWQQQDNAWENSVFAYNLSLACNHCVHPKCAGVCPVDAYVIRPDGIVYIDEAKCMGCGYCSWACPYAAPRYNPDLRHMTKCNFCFDEIDQGKPPACVAACPMRVLDFVAVDTSPSLNAGGGRLTVDSGRWTMDSQPSMVYRPLWETPATEHPFPLPQYSHTEPHLAIQPHPGMMRKADAALSNQEEVKTGSIKSELPLVAFTLLGQMAAGMAVLSFFGGPLTIPVLITMGGLMGVGAFVSLLHLGSPWNAWRALAHLEKSWLSREILLFGLFGASWLVGLALPGMGKLPLALTGIGFVYSMAQVYRLRSVPAWDTDRTLLAFSVSALVLGGLALEVLGTFAADTRAVYPLAVPVTAVGLVVALGLLLTDRDRTHPTAHRLRLGSVGLGLAGVGGMAFVPHPAGMWLAAPLFVIILIGEIIGRWLFYEHIRRRLL